MLEHRKRANMFHSVVARIMSSVVAQISEFVHKHVKLKKVYLSKDKEIRTLLIKVIYNKVPKGQLQVTL